MKLGGGKEEETLVIFIACSENAIALCTSLRGGVLKFFLACIRHRWVGEGICIELRCISLNWPNSMCLLHVPPKIVCPNSMDTFILAAFA